MPDIMEIPVIHYESDHVPNPNPLGDTPLEDFWGVRASILAASQPHGVTGPDFSLNEEPRYYLVEDQYNDELYQYMEVHEPEGWTIEWISSLIACLRQHKGWGIGIGNLDGGYVLVFANRVMVTGPAFDGCHELKSVVAAARQSAMRLHEKRYGALRRQLAYIKRRLPNAMREAAENKFAHVATFDRYKLHHATTVWILQTTHYDDLTLGNDSVPRGTVRAVTGDGNIQTEHCRDFWPYTDTLPPYWLTAYLIEDRNQTEVQMNDREMRTVGTIRIARVVTDGELKQLDLETDG